MMTRFFFRALPFMLSMPLLAQEQNFDFESVIGKARELASKPYAAPAEVPRFLRDLNYQDYQGIRFKPESSLWHDEDTPFKVMMMPPGLFYRHAVRMNIVEDGAADPVNFEKRQFTYPNPDIERLVPADMGYAGFKLTFPFEGPDVMNQFLVFGGASYYRAVGKENNFGLSGRGIAVDTGLPSGEEFPSFVEFWLEKPTSDAETMTFYGLLDGESLAGAYKFTVTPGEQTELKVESALFPRNPVEMLGLAPLTSMFYYGENTLHPAGEWRPEVHDSDGLLIHDGGTDEWLWRPLRNPSTLSIDYFATQNVRGFGLIQRDTDFTSYMDLEARYESRPSAWIEPEGDWGQGHVVLVQLPTSDETNDNTVAFWRTDGKISKEQSLHFNYTARFGNDRVAGEPLARAVDTYLGDGMRVGGGTEPGSVRVIVDFVDGPLADLQPDAPVVGHVSGLEDTEVLEHFVEYVEPLHRWRLSALVRPAGDKPLALRAYLSQHEETLSETWSYQLPPGNGVLGVIQRK
ncbi:glucan biosynthesis protein G [Pseudomonas saliphila]|uniref:glucan biosynthesis protein G n=1 Tax=Pseudomonas saliphila TaxID=2586906 RepID=UPI0019D62BF7|nr:glucan biosynthesis protein G [Pseudomonas saliphila]